MTYLDMTYLDLLNIDAVILIWMGKMTDNGMMRNNMRIRPDIASMGTLMSQWGIKKMESQLAHGLRWILDNHPRLKGMSIWSPTCRIGPGAAIAFGAEDKSLPIIIHRTRMRSL